MRATRGQMALSLNLVIAIFVVGSLGLVSYELSRILLAREQLKHCLELAALAGGASMASTSQTGQAARDQAVLVAMNLLKKNSILGQKLTTNVTQCSSMASLIPATGKVAAYFEFIDPVTKQPSAANQDNNVLRVYGAYAYPLFSGGFGAIGVSVYTVLAEATAGLPAVDVVIVYDNNSSNDDQTQVTAVRRYWDPTIPEIAYYIPQTPPTEGKLGAIFCAKDIGTAVNALPPQNLEAASDPRTSLCPKEFSEYGTNGKTRPLRGIADSNYPPGDAPPGAGGVGVGGMSAGTGAAGAPGGAATYAALPERTSPYSHVGDEGWMQELLAAIDRNHAGEQSAKAWFTPGYNGGSGTYNPWGADPEMFTDVVVNLDGNAHFNSYFPGTGPFANYKFRGLDYLVEASRGNMEDNNLTPNVHTSVAIDADAKTGYQNAYKCLAYRQLQPKGTVEQALRSFMLKLTQSSDCHFGFVAYGDRAGTAPNDTIDEFAVSWAYPVAGKVQTLMPQIPLDPNSNNYARVVNVLTPPTNTTGAPFPMMTPSGGSNLADGLTQAYQNLTGASARAGALKVILVLTNKVPTRDLAGNVYSDPNANGPAISDARTVADRCNGKGIPIFVVALDQNGLMSPYLDAQFSDSNKAGLVATAGHGGNLYITNWTNSNQTYSDLVGNFNNVVRQLMSLVSATSNASSAGGAAGS